MKRALLFLSFVTFAIAGTGQSPTPNSYTVFEDSCRIDSTETKTLPLIWVDRGNNLSMVIEARDDSSAGFASDSACVKVSLFQGFPVNNGRVVKLNSHANPDSTTGNGGSKWNLFDSLDIKSMDTACVYVRNSVSKAFSMPLWGDSLKTKTQAGYGAFAYARITPDYSPCMAVQLTGLASNKKKGVGSIWRVRVVQLATIPVKGN